VVYQIASLIFQDLKDPITSMIGEQRDQNILVMPIRLNAAE
jgi:hypothetical protein